jgi:hypothetical protein
MKPAVMRAAIAAGAAMVNDVRALQERGAIDAVASSNAAVCLMHMRGEPRTMQANPHYGDVVREVRDFLVERALTCEAAGIARDRIAIDPGFGFGKTMAHNLELLRALFVLTQTGYPVLAGLSRKATIGHLTGRDVGDRMAGSVAAALAAVARGAAIVRVHDVRETVDALNVWRRWTTRKPASRRVPLGKTPQASSGNPTIRPGPGGRPCEDAAGVFGESPKTDLVAGGVSMVSGGVPAIGCPASAATNALRRAANRPVTAMRPDGAAARLTTYANRPGGLILALPRGGVPVVSRLRRR